MTKNKKQANVTGWPAWLAELQNQGLDPYYTTSGHAWIRFHKFAFMRFPPNDSTPVSREEARELFRKARAVMLSHHHEPEAGESPNAYLYLCRDKEYDISRLSSNNRSKVRRGLKRLDVRQATAEEIAAKGYQCTLDTLVRNGLNSITREQFEAVWRKDADRPFRELWAAFAGDEIAAIGIVWLCGRWAELYATASANEYLKDYSNHALFYTILHDLMHRGTIDSVSYGLSSVQLSSKSDSLHHFKLSVNMEAVPVVRKIDVNPIFKPVINPVTLAAFRSLEWLLPGSRHIRSARGALELMFNTAGARLPFEEDGVRPMLPADAGMAAKIHRQVFPLYFSTRLGARYCELLYSAYAERPEAFGCVAVRDGEIAGFVVGGRAGIQEAIDASLRKHMVRGLLLHPAALLKTAGRLTTKVFERLARRKIRRSLSAEKEMTRTAKLVLIGVSESARGTGTAGELLKHFVEEAAKRGFEKVMLVVARGNERARAAYEKAGWQLSDAGGESVEYFVNLSKDQNTPD